MFGQPRLQSLCLSALLWLTFLPRQAAGEELYDALNTMEQATVDRALAEGDLQIDETPGGKVFGQLIVVSLDVFLDDTEALMWLNDLHATTSPAVIEGELLWEAGDEFDIALVEESVRNLRLRINLSVVAMVPVVSSDPAHVVDILSVTRDTWSLRLNTIIEGSSLNIDSLLVSLEERNLFGEHKSLALSMLWEPDTIRFGPGYVDPRLSGSRLVLSESFRLVLNHETGDLEGTTNELLFGLPLYSLDSRWGFEVAQRHTIGVDRLFVGSELATYDNPDTEVVEALPIEIDQSVVDVSAVGLLGLGRELRHIISFGYGLSDRQFDPVAADIDETTRAAFERDFLPTSDLSSFVTLGYALFEADYTTVRNYQTFAFAEDFRLGFKLILDLQLAPTFLGSDTDFVGTLGAIGYSVIVADALMSATLETSGRFELSTDEVVDRTVAGLIHLASPVWGIGRLHLGGIAIVRYDRRFTAVQTLGGGNGLRGFPTGAFLGESALLAHAEYRTLSIDILSQYFGLVVFFDAGSVFNEGEDPVMLSDFGLGIRWLFPQLQRIVYRLDYGFPTSGPSSFFPGVLTFGFEQVF
jgi:hypothetical protein